VKRRKVEMEDFISNWRPKQISSVNLLHYALSSFENIAKKIDHQNTKKYVLASIYFFKLIGRNDMWIRNITILILNPFRGQFWSVIR
jgi:hypothetical protein